MRNLEILLLKVFNIVVTNHGICDTIVDRAEKNSNESGDHNIRILPQMLSEDDKEDTVNDTTLSGEIQSSEVQGPVNISLPEFSEELQANTEGQSAAGTAKKTQLTQDESKRAAIQEKERLLKKGTSQASNSKENDESSKIVEVSKALCVKE